MKLKFILGDISRGKIITAVTVLLIATTAMLVSPAAGLAINLISSIDRLMGDAKAPHFMQMHSGNFPTSELKTFAARSGDIGDSQILKFLNLDGSDIILGGHMLIGSLQDNGLCTQSSRLDFLLDLDQRPAKPAKEELHVPICYLRDGTARAGDTAMVGGIPFTVANFIWDSQMNSMLISSKHFPVSEDSYRQSTSSGTVEYLTEFRLRDLSKLGAFKTKHRNAGLPVNGPSLTWLLFRMINAVSSGILVAVILLISPLVIIIALLCTRFTLQAKIEDDYREIRVMETIGMRVIDIRNLYLAIYTATAMTGDALGFLLSLPVREQTQVQIWLSFGDSRSPAPSIPVDIAATVLIVLLVLLYVIAQLRRFRTISPTQTIRFGMEQGSGDSTRIFLLTKSRRFPLSPPLAIQDVLSRKKLCSTMLAVIILVSSIMTTSRNPCHTISDSKFVTYMGVGICGLHLDLQQIEQLDGKAAAVEDHLEQDRNISLYMWFTTKIFSAKLSDGSKGTLKIELGDHTTYPLQYIEGYIPNTDRDIALSVLSAEDLEKMIGDTMTIITGHGEQTLTVCGVCPDITDGGETVRASFDGTATPAAQTTICATLTDQDMLDEKIASHQAGFPYAKISSIDDYVAQTFGQTLHSVKSAFRIAILAVAFITPLVTLLLTKMPTSKDRYSIAIVRALDFTGSDIRSQYIWRAVTVLTAGTLAGTILANTLDEQPVGLAISSFGVVAFHFQINPLSTYLLSPLALLAAALAVTVWGTGRAGDVPTRESIKE